MILKFLSEMCARVYVYLNDNALNYLYNRQNQ